MTICAEDVILHFIFPDLRSFSGIRKSLRQQIDEGSHLGGDVMAVRIDRIDGKFARLMVFQNADEAAGFEIFAGHEGGSEKEATALERGAAQDLRALRYQVPLDRDLRWPAVRAGEAPFVPIRVVGIAQAIVTGEIFKAPWLRVMLEIAG